MGRNSRTKGLGFTLIELMISLAILTMIMLIGVTSYRILAENWSRQRGEFDQRLAQFKAFDLSYASVKNTRPYYVTTSSMDTTEEAGTAGPAFYFLGDEQGFTGVTSNSVVSPGSLAIYRILREPQGNGQFRLVYEEAALTEPLLSLDQTLPFSYRQTLFYDIEEIGFNYRGWDSLAQMMESSETDQGARWFKKFDGEEKQHHPVAIKIKLDEVVWQIDVPDVSLEVLDKQLGQDF